MSSVQSRVKIKTKSHAGKTNAVSLQVLSQIQAIKIFHLSRRNDLLQRLLKVLQSLYFGPVLHIAAYVGF